MPVLVNPKVCINREHCFAADACPYGAYFHNSLKKSWEVDANVCGDCPGPCLNFCDQDALRWGDDLEDLKLVKAGIEGTMTPEEVLEARAKHKREKEEAAKKQSEEGVIALTRANFEREVLRSQVPVVVDCWAAWCGPCKQFSPIFEATAKQYVGVIKFAKLDTDAEPALAQGLGVQALPTTLMFYKGQLVNAAEGALPADRFQAWLYQTLAAIRQYEAQFEAEAEGAVSTASERMATMNGEPSGESTPTGGGSSSLSQDDTTPRQGPAKKGGSTELPGRQTSSGLYIP